MKTYKIELRSPMLKGCARIIYVKAFSPLEARAAAEIKYPGWKVFPNVEEVAG